MKGNQMPMRYEVKRVAAGAVLSSGWDEAPWNAADTAAVDKFLPRSSDHHPSVAARMVHDGAVLLGAFAARDKYVRCVVDQNQGSVCGDSCVEFFVRPKRDKGYFNFEINCGGTILCYYIQVDGAGAGDMASRVALSPEDLALVGIVPSLPRVVEPELQVDTLWTLKFSIPFALLEKYVGPLGSLSGQVWRGNFYKCADKTSHPHWAAWSPVDAFNFHLPRCFGELKFE